MEWPETTWNNLQQARIDLKQTTTSKKRPKTTYNEQKTNGNNLQPPETTYDEHRKYLKRPTTSRSLDYFIIWDNHIFHSIFDCNHSSTSSWRIIMETECQTFIYYHVHLLRTIKFAGYFVNHLDTSKLAFVRQKPTLWIKVDIKIKFWHR